MRNSITSPTAHQSINTSDFSSTLSRTVPKTIPRILLPLIKHLREARKQKIDVAAEGEVGEKFYSIQSYIHLQS